eukprot:6349823-Prymnesium_polylepis.2
MLKPAQTHARAHAPSIPRATGVEFIFTFVYPNTTTAAPPFNHPYHVTFFDADGEMVTDGAGVGHHSSSSMRCSAPPASSRTRGTTQHRQHARRGHGRLLTVGSAL